MNNPISISKKLYLSTNDLMRVTEVKGNSLIYIIDQWNYLYFRINILVSARTINLMND